MPRKATKNAVMAGFMSLRDGRDGHPVSMTFTWRWMQNETGKFPNAFDRQRGHAVAGIRVPLERFCGT
ncbi:hypothetical protein CEE69_29190 [Rhodopirellula bahusiensis]|uniref:Uncharacterized protein n=1 Tax=Rhodopirellula bahusiensis TaxID=2014065 RepID=A0A2G1VZE5_9BACT|nr:hypothetical protein CEE69_29190 [Rhodopirellula bahusiensis]